MITLLKACRDNNLFSPWFKKSKTWDNWFAFLAALFALPLTPDQLTTYQQCTGRTTPPTAPINEAWLVCGRRAGKSFVLALVAVFLACFHDWRPYLARGETGTIVVICVDRRQASTIFRYVRGLLNGVPMLRRMILRETAEAFELNNRIAIEIQTAIVPIDPRLHADRRALRRDSLLAQRRERQPRQGNPRGLAPGDGDHSRRDVAVRLVPLRSPRCACGTPTASTTASDSPVLIWKAPTRTMNPSRAAARHR